MSIYEILPDDDHHHYFCRFELENMSIYEILPALDLTQSVHDKICIRMHRGSNFKGTGYDYPDLPGLGKNNEKLGLSERLSTGIQLRFRNLFHGKKSGNRNFIC